MVNASSWFVPFSCFLGFINSGGCTGVRSQCDRFLTSPEEHGLEMPANAFWMDQEERELYLEGPEVRSIDFINGWPLFSLTLRDTSVSDLTPLRYSPLAILCVIGTNRLDLSPLADVPLTMVTFGEHVLVDDLTPLMNCPLERVEITPSTVKHGLWCLGQIPTLHTVETGTVWNRRSFTVEQWRAKYPSPKSALPPKDSGPALANGVFRENQ